MAVTEALQQKADLHLGNFTEK